MNAPVLTAEQQSSRERRLPAPMQWLAFAAGGVAAGVLAKLADASVTWLADVATYLSVWVVVIVVIGVLAPTVWSAALRAALGVLSMCAGYYVTTAWVFNYPVGREAVFWSALAVTVVPALAALVWAARRADRWWSAIIAGFMAALCLGDGAVFRVYIAVTEQMPEGYLLTVRPVQATIEVVAAALVVVLVPRSAKVRWLALAIASGATWVVAGPGVELRGVFGI